MDGLISDYLNLPDTTNSSYDRFMGKVKVLKSAKESNDIVSWAINHFMIR